MEDGAKPLKYTVGNLTNHSFGSPFEDEFDQERIQIGRERTKTQNETLFNCFHGSAPRKKENVMKH